MTTINVTSGQSAFTFTLNSGDVMNVSASTDSLAAEHGSREKLATVRVAVNLSNGGQSFFLDLEHLRYCAIAIMAPLLG